MEFQWLPEICESCIRPPKFLIVGLQIDLRHDLKEAHTKEKTMFVTTEAGHQMAEQIGAVKYIECSTETRVNSNLFLLIVVNTSWPSVSFC